MDLILYNGKIHTMTGQIHETIGIQGKKIVGFNMNPDDYSCEKIDLKGRPVYPGFNDSHMHLLGYGASLSQVDLQGAQSINDIIQITKDYIKEHQVEAGKWIIGRGWNQDHFPQAVMPSRHDLDKISHEHFIFLSRACGHVATVNTKVLSALNLSDEKTQVEGGEYENGIFKENAIDLISNNIPDPSIEDMKNYILEGARALHKMGITSVQSDDLCVYPENLTEDIFTAFKELGDDLPLKVYEQSLFRNIENFKKYLSKGYKQNDNFGNFRLGPLKILGDGSLGGRTAWIKDGYHDAETEGIHMYSQTQLDELVLTAQKHDIAVAIHCIGDAMLDSALQSIEKANQKYPKKLRHGIVHCQITRPDQLQKMRALDILAYVQPIFLDYDIHIVYDRVGKKADTSYAWQTMKTLGIPTPFGSDAPVETPDPIKGIHCAVYRQDLKSKPEGAYLKDQALTLEDGLNNYTLAGAYASYEEEIKGKVLEGYIADLVVLNKVFDHNILENSVDITIVDGKIVYKK